ncbi:SURF1 family protein [Comamonas serinivorans]|uniref:SURF1 family protein n=1 Tax=Comamonas serinivorans TaxID=1082851 RepID=UPI0012FBB01D|nr:SURF1 family protein [Comamonas serinivorans]
MPRTRQGSRMNGRRIVIAMVAALAFGVTLRAGFWQMDRAQQKVAAQANRAAQARHGPLDTAGVIQALARSTPAPHQDPHQDDLLDRTVQVRGRWLAEHTVYLDNRSMDGRAGFFVLTPLVLAPARGTDVRSSGPGDAASGAADPSQAPRHEPAEGSDRPTGATARPAPVIWVQRGWAPRHATDRERLPPVTTPPDDVVLVSGRLADQPSRRYVLGADGVGPIRQNLAAPQMQALVQQPVLSMVVVQTDAPSDGLLRNWPPPEFGADKNRGYAVQWFGMAALIWVLYVWFQLVRPLRNRRA